jgi:hypothetical protein
VSNFYQSLKTNTNVRINKWKRQQQSLTKKDELKRLMKLFEKKQKKKPNPSKIQVQVHAAIVIQKWVRGYYQRKEYKKHRDGIRKIRRLRRILSVGYKKVKSRFIKSVISAVKESGKVVKKKRAQVLKKYKNYCANLIQKNWKGYIVRRYIVPEMLDYLDAQHRAMALLKGWQMRKIVSCGEVAAIIQKIQEIANYQRQIMNDPNSINLVPMLAHNRKCEVLNFLITIHRLSQTGEWIKSKRINPNSAHYQNYMMQQNQYQNFMPYMNPSMFLNQSMQYANQSMQYANQPMMNLDASLNRQKKELPVQSEPQNKLTPSPRSDKKPDNFLTERASLVGFDNVHRGSQNIDEVRGSRGSVSKHYDTVNEQVPLPKPKHDYEDEAIQTRFEFGNVDFNENNSFKLGTTTKNPRAKSKDKSFDEIPVCIITGGLGGGSGGGAGGEEVHLDLFDDPFPTKKPKPKPKKKKDLKEKRKFLKKRQKYDPRKAIEKEKQRKVKKSNKKAKSAFPKGFFKNENGGEDISETEEEEPQESNEKSSESETEPEPETKKRLTQKEVKIRKESRSEKRKTRATTKPTKPTKTSKPQPPVKDESDEGSPERRLDSTPKKKEKKNKKIVKVEKPKQINDKQISDRKIPSAAKVKSKNVQFQKLNWGKVQRKIDCWKNVPPPPQPENEEEEEVNEIIEKTPERLQHRPVEIKKIQRPVAVKNFNLASDEMEPEETRLIMSLDKEGEEIEIIEMNEDEIPYKKVVVRKGDQDQYDIQVYEEGEDHIRNDDFSDDYDSEELSVPEEREADEYVYSDQKNDEQEESVELANQQQQNDQSYYTDEDSANILPLNIDELDNLHEEVHGLNTEIQI